MEVSESFYEFVEAHARDDVHALRLKYGSASALDFEMDFAITQIESRNKSAKKIPGFISHRKFLFPSVVAFEQATNEAVASYHSSLINPDSSLLDLTAGLGIDDLTFALNGIRVETCEVESFKCEILRHNAEILNVSDKLDVVHADSIEYLKNTDKTFDIIFADPARRGKAGNRLHALSDCMPDILGNEDLILQHTSRLLVKCSPLLDISFIIRTVRCLKHIHVVCFRGECKEILLDISKDESYTGATVVDLDWNHIISIFETRHTIENSNLKIKYAGTQSPADYKYLYEPNSGVMKTGAWDVLATKYPDVVKADANTHLFFSDTLYPDFPGRILAIECMADKKKLKSMKGSRCNIVARNHPLSSPQISEKYGIVSGGEKFLYAFSCKGKRLMLISEPVTAPPLQKTLLGPKAATSKP